MYRLMSFESFSWFRTWPISGSSAVEGSLLNNSDSAFSGNNGTVGTVVNSGSNVLGRCDPILLLVSCHYIYVVGGNCDARYPDVAQGNIKGKKSQSAWNVFRQIRPYRSGTSLSAVWDPVMAGKSTCPPYRLYPTVIPVPNETDRCFIFGGFGKSNSTHPMGFNDIWEIKIHKRSRCNASRRKNCAESNSTEEEMVWIPHKCKGSEVVRLGTSTLSSFEKDARSVQSVTPRKRFNAAGASWKDVLRKSVTSDKETDNEKFGLLIFGGMCIESTAVESHASTESVFSDMWLYLTAKDMWVQIHGRFDEYGGLDTAGITHIEDSPCARSRASLITVTCDTASEYTCDVYLFGGISGRGTLLNDLWHTRLDLDLIHYRLEWRKRNAEDDTAMNDTWPSCVNFKERESSREFGWNTSDTKSVLCDPVVCMWRKIQWWDMIAVHPTLEPMAQIFLKKIVCRPAIIMNTRRKQEDGTHGAFGLPSCLWVCGPSSCTYRSNVWMLHPIESDVHDASLTRTPIWRFSTFSGAEIRDMGAAASSPASIYFEARLNHVACWSSADQELYVGFGIQGAGVPPRSLLDLWVIREIKVHPRE